MASLTRYHHKIKLIHEFSKVEALAELKIFEVPVSRHYPDGLKYSLFLVLKDSGKILVGFDNHKPKGHHLHINLREEVYEFSSIELLVKDFWDLVRKQGFLL